MNHFRKKMVLCVCFSLIAAIPALAYWSQQAPQLSKLTDSDLRKVVVHLERTRCYGDCPAYKLTVYGDGRVEYDGEDHVKVKGKKEALIELADIRRIVTEFDQASYFSMQQYTEEHCSCTLCTDMPTTITEIKIEGFSHRVEHYHGCTCAPKPLWNLEQSIDRIAGTERWTGDVSKQGPRGTTCFHR
jgi:hypothetical protein